MIRINHREATGFWLNQASLTGRAAEIGCAKGDFARTVLSQWNGTRYFMIDPWAKQDPSIYKERTNADGEFESWLKACQELAKADPRVKLMQMLSEQAAPLIENGSLDFVYIDGNHAYGAVMRDLDDWWPKVRIGGILAGHDFYERRDNGYFVEVEPAVIRWTQEHNLPFEVTPCTSWWIYKDRA